MSAAPRAQAQKLLRSNFGFSDFLPGQAEVLDAVFAGRDVLAVMPTGSGKSLLYQLPAALGPGLVVVASPLIALMRDQLRTLADKSIVAVALHSAQQDAEALAAKAALASGRAQLLYASPERLALPETQQMLRSKNVRLFAVDEAHCISQWGHEFRPDYLALGAVARALGAPVLAVTATAGPRTRADIAQHLFAHPPQIFLRSFARPNLSLHFARRKPGLRQIVDFAARAGGAGIVYCNSRRTVDVMAQNLARLGVDALPYHAGLDAYTRVAHQDAFFARPGAVMVATIAFGMGVDRPDVRFVVHADLPTSVEGYYQEIGRAGRDGAPARALGLFNPAELALRWRGPLGAVGDVAAGDYARRRAMAGLAVAPGCRFQALLAEFGEDSAPCGACDHCRGPFRWVRRANALWLGWRAALESRLSTPLAPELDDAPPQDPGAAPVLIKTAAPPPLSVADERLLLALVAARGKIAKQRGLAPRRVAGDAALRRLATARPLEPGDPLFAEIIDAPAFVSIISRAP